MSDYEGVINIDLDGVIYPWHEVFSLYTYSMYDDNPHTGEYDWDFGNMFPLPSPNGWNFGPQWGLTNKEFMELFRRGVDDGFIWTEGRPLPTSQNAMWRLDDYGYYLRIVTKRLVHKNNHAQVQRVTSEWLDKWNIPYHEIVYVGSSGKDSFGADFAIDDNPAHYFEQKEAGVDAYLLYRTWNAEMCDPEEVDFVYDLGQFADALTDAWTIDLGDGSDATNTTTAT